MVSNIYVQQRTSYAVKIMMMKIVWTCYVTCNGYTANVFKTETKYFQPTFKKKKKGLSSPLNFISLIINMTN